MRFELFFSEIADEQMDILESSKDKKAICNAVKKTLRFMETNLKHPSLNTHAYESITGPNNVRRYLSLMHKTILQVPIVCFGIMAQTEATLQFLPLFHIHK